MPIIKSAIKRMHQAAKARVRNAATKRGLKASLKSFSGTMTAENLQKAQSEIDKAVKKNLLDKNTAARRKAKLVRQAKAAGAKPAVAKKAATKPAAAKTTKPAAKKPAVTKAATAKKPATKKPAAKKPATKKA